MKEITYHASGFTPSPIQVTAGLLKHLASLVSKGMSFGLVLFLALSTLSFLNHGAGYLEVSLKKTMKKTQDMPGTVMVSYARPREASSAYAARPAQKAEPAQDMPRVIRESRDFVSELGYFARTLERFGR